MNKKDEALQQGRDAINNVRGFMKTLMKDINSGDSDKESNALITLKALDAFIREESGLSFWCFQVRKCIAESIEKYRHLH